MAESRAQYQERAAAEQKLAAAEHAQRQVETHLAITRRREEQNRELLRAWGDGSAVFVKNPELNIAITLEAIGRSVAPRKTRVDVSVDRFTHFDAKFELPAELPAAGQAAISARLLEFGSPYLQHISFFANRRLIGELHQPAMAAAVANRSAPDEAALAKSLVATLSDPPAPSQPATAKVETERLSDGADAYQKIVADWQDAFQKHGRSAGQVVERLNQAVELKTLKAKTDVAARLKTVEAAARDIAAAQAYLPQALDSLKQQMTAAAYDPLIVEITMRETSRTARPLLQDLGRMFAALDSLQASVSKVLLTLEKHTPDWKISDKGVVFTSPAAVTAFNLAAGDLHASLEQVTKVGKTLQSAP